METQNIVNKKIESDYENNVGRGKKKIYPNNRLNHNR